MKPFVCVWTLKAQTEIFHIHWIRQNISFRFVWWRALRKCPSLRIHCCTVCKCMIAKKKVINQICEKKMAILTNKVFLCYIPRVMLPWDFHTWDESLSSPLMMTWNDEMGFYFFCLFRCFFGFVFFFCFFPGVTLLGCCEYFYLQAVKHV